MASIKDIHFALVFLFSETRKPKPCLAFFTFNFDISHTIFTIHLKYSFIEQDVHSFAFESMCYDFFEQRVVFFFSHLPYSF